MKRLIAGLVVLICLAPATAHAEPGWRLNECRYQYHDGKAGWAVYETKATIRCAAAKFDVSLTTANYVADRESSFHAWAYNRYGCGGAGCLGVFQHHADYWSGRVANIPDWLGPLDPSAFNARTNILAALKMAQASWSPWGL